MVNELENDIILLNQLEKAITKSIDKSPIYPKLLHVWDVNTKLLEEYKGFRHVGLKPHLARGLIAEVMCKYVLQHWAKEKGHDCRIMSNLLIPRIDGGTTQLDLLLISNDFAMVVECKSLYGRMSIKNGEIKTMKDTLTPWKQNMGHIMSLKNVLEGYNIYFRNAVYIFSFGSITKYEPSVDEDLLVNINSMNELDRMAKDVHTHHRRTLSKSELDDIENILTEYIPNVTEEAEHIRFVSSLNK